MDSTQNPNKALWEKGDFTRLADTMRDSGEKLVAQLGVKPGMKVLDLGCGDGTTAIPEAQAGATVRGVDIARNLVEAGRRRATALGIANITFEEGDASHLDGIADDSFDLTVSIFGAMFAPRPFDVARQMVRVTRPGGRVVVIDATPTAGTQAAYDRMETLRDPSHASALTLEQLRALGREAGLTETVLDFHRLDARLQALADAADMAALTALFDADIASGEDRIGVQARRDADGIVFRFPISIIAWTK